MTISAKYPSQCSQCHRPIAPGDRIEWTQGQPVRHTTCPTTSGPVVVPVPRTGYGANIEARIGRMDRRGGAWTGCRCGSREDAYGNLIDSPRNCASCEYDA